MIRSILPRLALAVGLLFAGHAARAETVIERFSKHLADSKEAIDHTAWTKLLATYVKPGADGVARVDYGKFKAEGHAELKRYVAGLEKVKVTGLARAEQFAFWANLYNAKTIDIVLDHYPVKSIKDIRLGGTFLASITGGPWKAKVMTVEGLAISLDDIEHGLLRPSFKDPRVHYAVNCASIGCPDLGQAAFTGAKLEEQLDEAARVYINHPRGLQVTDGKVKASSIFSWFQADFGGSASGVLDHARKYARPELKKSLEGRSTIDSFDYDWRLNDAPR